MLDSPAHSLPIARMRHAACVCVCGETITTPYAERRVVLLVRPLLYVVPLFPLTTLSQEGIPKSDCISPGKESNRHFLQKIENRK